jgi:putative intracellular protease/amidase
MLVCFSALALAAPPPSPADERLAFVEAMAPRGNDRPVIAVLALNEGTEITDLMLPHALLRRADVADVHVVAPRAGIVQLYPALRIDGVMGFDEFAKRYPRGPDYVIVPAMERDDDPAVTAWLARQAERGARVIGVCAGGQVLARAGLLDGRRFVTHWYYREDIAKRHPTSRLIVDRRYVVDRGVATSTGVTASMPTMLALVEALGGRKRAQALADEIGLGPWDPFHDSASFGLTVRRGFHYLVNRAAFWRGERWQAPVQDGMDDVALALVTDAWGRTGHIDVEASAAAPRVTLRSGLVLLAQKADPQRKRLTFDAAMKPALELDITLCKIEWEFGAEVRRWVMQVLEYATESACK